MNPSEPIPHETTPDGQTLRTEHGEWTIRRAVESDLPDVVALLADDLLGSQREASEMGAYRAAFAEIDSDPNQFQAVVCDAAGTVVGTIQLTLVPGLSRGGVKRLLIEGVRLGSSVRGAGLGSALFAWAHEYGRAHGAVLAQLTSDRQRTDALRFYEQLGYEPSHVGFKKPL